MTNNGNRRWTTLSPTLKQIDKDTVYFGYNLEKAGQNWKLHSLRM